MRSLLRRQKVKNPTKILVLIAVLLVIPACVEQDEPLTSDDSLMSSGDSFAVVESALTPSTPWECTQPSPTAMLFNVPTAEYPTIQSAVDAAALETGERVIRFGATLVGDVEVTNPAGRGPLTITAPCMGNGDWVWAEIGWPGTGMLVTDSEEVTLTGFRVTGQTGAGITIANSTHIDLDMLMPSNNTDAGIQIDDSGDVSMSRIEAYNNGTGVAVDDGTDISLDESRLLGNWDGMTVDFSFNVSANEVTAYDSTMYGFHVYASERVTLSSVRAVQSGQRGAYVMGGRRNTVEYSVFRDNFIGIYVLGGLGGNMVANNQLVDNSYGVVVRDQGAWIHNNLFSSNVVGLYDLMSTGTLMSNNTIADGRYSAIGVYARSTDLRMQDNILSGNNYGVYALSTTTGLQAENNNYWDNGANTVGPVNTISQLTIEPFYEEGYYYSQPLLKGIGLWDQWEALFDGHVTTWQGSPDTHFMVDLGYHHATPTCVYPDPDSDRDGTCDDRDPTPF